MTKMTNCVELRNLMLKVIASLAMSEEIRAMMVANEKLCIELIYSIKPDSAQYLLLVRLIGSLLNDKDGHKVAKLLSKKIQYLIVGTDSKCVE